MKPTGLLIAAVLLAVCGGAAIWVYKHPEAGSAKSSTDTTKLLTIADDQFQEITIKKLTGETIRLHKDNGKWKIVEPKPLPADQDAVGSLVSSLSSLNADKVVEDKAADLKPYGLDHPTLDVSVLKKDGKTAELLIGDDTPTGSGSYAKLPGDAKVVTIATFTKTGIDKRPDDFRDKRLIAFDSDKLTRVELQAKGQTVEFGKNGQNEWQILKPRPLRADGGQVDTLIGKLKDAKMDLSATDPDVPKKFAAAPKVATISVTDAAGTQTLEVRRDKDKNAYAKGAAAEGEYKVANDVADAVDKGLDDFRNKKLFDFGFSDPSKVDLKNVSYIKAGDKWMSGGKAMDNTTVQTLIDKLRDLAAAKFAEKGGGSEVFSATVTSNGGKRVEKVTVTKSGSQYFAQRENEPSIYELDAKAVDDLTKAASDVKEAPPEAAKKK